MPDPSVVIVCVGDGSSVVVSPVGDVGSGQSPEQGGVPEPSVVNVGSEQSPEHGGVPDPSVIVVNVVVVVGGVDDGASDVVVPSVGDV